MKFRILPLLIIAAFSVNAQYSTLLIQDFDTIQTPAWNYIVTSGTLEFLNGNSPATALPANSPHGINGSWAWKQGGQSGGVTLTFDNVNIAGYDTAIITFKVAAFATTGSNGVDNLDHVTTAVSINNGVTWHDQVRVNGASSNNSSWPYSATGIASRVYSTSSATVFAPAASGLDLAGPATVIIKVPNTTNQVMLRITSRSSMAVEQYCIDNVEIQVKNMKCDAGLEFFENPADSLCSGLQPISVRLKNYGPGSLNVVNIHWNVNNVSQPVYSWSGNLPPNGTANVTIGNYNFLTGPSYNLTAYTSMPNTLPDTMNTNDTIHKYGVFVKPSPTINVSTNNLYGCQGDTLLVTGTLTGTPPWSVTIKDGNTNIPVGNITTPGFAVPLTPQATKTYLITGVSDATGCSSHDTITVNVFIDPSPPAVITPVGTTAACHGDSVGLMGSIGMNFGYEWYRNDSLISGSTTYVHYTKNSGSYRVKVSSPNGCVTMSAPVNVVIHPLPEVFLGNDTALLPGQNILLNAGPGFNSYLWSTGATMQSILVDSTDVGIGVKNIWVHVTDNYYCLGGDTILINFTNHPGIQEAFAKADIRIVPNPSDGNIELQLSNFPAGTYDFELFSPDGKAVYRSKHQLNNNKINLDLSHIANGVYVLKVSGTAGTVAEKIVIRN